MIVKTQAEAAAILGISQPRFNKLLHQGKLDSAIINKQKKRRQFDSERLKAAYLKNRDQMHSHREDKILKSDDRKRITEEDDVPEEVKRQAVNQSGIQASIPYQTARNLNEQYKAAMAKLAYEEKIGSMVYADKVASEWARHILAAKTILMGAKSKIAPKVKESSMEEVLKMAILKDIEEIIREALKELSEQKVEV